MNYLVFLNASAGELEKILSGMKSMLVKDVDPAVSTAHPVSPGDQLYFLREKNESSLRVKATVVRVLFCQNDLGDELSLILKEMQPRLQLTEDQYNYWSLKKQILLVEFSTAHKIEVIHVDTNQVKDRQDWIAF